MTEQPALARADCPRPLAGKKGLITGIANDHSIAYAVAKGARDAGADLALSYQNEKSAGYTRPLAATLDTRLFVKLDVSEPGAIESVVEKAARSSRCHTSGPSGWCGTTVLWA
jgi:enoyl-[acyl-carrier protein] reductase I